MSTGICQFVSFRVDLGMSFVLFRYISTKNPQQATSMFSLKRAQVSILVNWTLSFAYGCCWVTFIEFDMCVLNNGEMIDRYKSQHLLSCSAKTRYFLLRFELFQLHLFVILEKIVDR